MFASNDKKLEILNDHYKDSFSHLVSYRKQRDRLMLFLLSVLGIMILFQYFPNQISQSASKFVSTKIGVEFDLHILSPCRFHFSLDSILHPNLPVLAT